LSLLHFVDPRRAVLRITLAALAGVIAGAVAMRVGVVLPLLVGWNAGGLTLLGFSWTVIVGCDDAMTRKRAGAEDPGRTLVYVIVLLASSVSLIAALQLTRHIASLPPRDAATAEVLCLLTVALAWALTHTAFTLRYAHLYYREDDAGVGGVSFPGETVPSYFDFAYFAFTLGMCFQTSDVCITSSLIRRTALLHAVISFAYNTAIIAFVLNLVFGHVS
jgi:uncharacterized membrane protein